MQPLTSEKVTRATTWTGESSISAFWCCRARRGGWPSSSRRVRMSRLQQTQTSCRATSPLELPPFRSSRSVCSSTVECLSLNPPAVSSSAWSGGLPVQCGCPWHLHLSAGPPGHHEAGRDTSISMPAWQAPSLGWLPATGRLALSSMLSGADMMVSEPDLVTQQ